MKFLTDPQYVRHYPMISTVIMESASVAQLFRIWTEHTAAGQSLVAWANVLIALTLWFNWYRVVTPGQTIAKWSTVVSMVLVSAVLGSVIWWRYIV